MPGIESLTEVLVTELRDRQLGEKPRGKACAWMRGIIEEVDEHAGEEGCVRFAMRPGITRTRSSHWARED